MTDPALVMSIQEMIGSGDRNGIEEAIRKHPEVVQEKTLGSEITFLHYAADKERLDLVRYLFAQGVPLDTTNASQESPLSAVIRTGDIDTVAYSTQASLSHGKGASESSRNSGTAFS